MEVKGALEMWSQSEISRVFVMYNKSKGFLIVSEAKPHGSNVSIEKLERVGHVQKRMVRQLRQLCKEAKGLKLSGGKPIVDITI